MGEFRFEGHRIAYDEYGEGDRVIVLIHGLLMNSHMYERLGPELAAHGDRVVAINLLGHGPSDSPTELPYYSMSSFADQVLALLDHLKVEQAVIGGTSLGANVSLEFASRTPKRARALFMEMPVLENALLAVAVIFTPIMLTLELGAPLLRLAAGTLQRIPRSTYLVDIALDWVRRDPKRSADVLQGLLLGRSAPLPEERKRLQHPALVIGHPRDPLHPFTDAGMVVHEMPNAQLVDANSILEWRINPGRLDDELAAFLDEVWQKPGPKRGRKTTGKAAGKRKASAKAASSNSQNSSKSRGKTGARKSGKTAAKSSAGASRKSRA